MRPAGDGTALVIHLSTQLEDGRWVVEPRRIAGRATERWVGPPPLRHLELAAGASVDPGGAVRRPGAVVGRQPRPRAAVARVAGRARSTDPLRLRRPAVADRDVPERLRHRAGQRRDAQCGPTLHPGGHHPPGGQGSRGRPLVLHTGVASLEADELPYPERVRVPEATAEQVNAAHRGGHRVIAVGTTVVRALETSAEPTEPPAPTTAGPTW